MFLTYTALLYTTIIKYWKFVKNKHDLLISIFSKKRCLFSHRQGVTLLVFYKTPTYTNISNWKYIKTKIDNIGVIIAW